MRQLVVCRVCQVLRAPLGIQVVSVRHKFTRWQDEVKEKDQRKDEERLERRWLSDTMYLTAEKLQDVLPPKDYEDQTFKDVGHPGFDWVAGHQGVRYLDLSPKHLLRMRKKKMLRLLQFDQRFIAERHVLLGPDLAAAHFIVHRNGAVKFVGDDRWYQRDGGFFRDYKLPTKRDDLFIEAIDASKMQLVWEGFDNLSRLKHLRLLSLADCLFVNDWCMEKLNKFSNTLEFLDLSNCKKISANGLSSLSCLKNLKFLRVDGLNQIKNLAKVALMLEEANPKLTVVGVDYDLALESCEKDAPLLENQRVVEDARGNLHVKDRSGDLYYLLGPGLQHEKPMVDEFGLPLVVNRVRKDPPDLPLEEFDWLNAMSEGKLKHQLIGSPSGSDWSAETERLLTFEAYKMLAEEDKLPEPALLPECMKMEAVKETISDRVKKFLPIGAEFEASLPPYLKQKLSAKERESPHMLMSGFMPDSAGKSLKLSSETEVPRIGDDKNTAEMNTLSADPMSEISANDEKSSHLLVKSKPPKPRPPRLFTKFSRFTSQI